MRWLPALILCFLSRSASADEGSLVAQAASRLIGTMSYQAAQHDPTAGFKRADGNELGRWAHGGAAPQRLNCWEMLYLAAAQAGVIAPRQILAVQKKAQRTAQRRYASAMASNPGYRINHQISALFSSANKAVGPLGYYQGRQFNKASAVPAGSLRAGDVVFFGHNVSHAALALGTRDAKGAPEVISIDRDSRTVRRTTIGALASKMRGERAPHVPVRIARPPWRKLARRSIELGGGKDRQRHERIGEAAQLSSVEPDPAAAAATIVDHRRHRPS